MVECVKDHENDHTSKLYFTLILVGKMIVGCACAKTLKAAVLACAQFMLRRGIEAMREVKAKVNAYLPAYTTILVRSDGCAP